MRVLWIAEVPPKTGVFKHPVPWVHSLLSTLRSVKELDITVVNVVADYDGEYVDDGVRYVFLKGPRERFNYLTYFLWKKIVLFKWIRSNQNNFDLIHVHGTESGGHFLLWKLRVPYVISLQGILSELLPFYKGLVSRKRLFTVRSGAFYEKLAFNKTRYFFGRTEWDKGIVREETNDAHYFHVNEVLRSPFYNATIQPSKESIVFVGGGLAPKGLPFGLSVLNHLHKMGTYLEFQIVGKEAESVIHVWRSENPKNEIDWSIVQCHGFLEASELIEVYKGALCLIHPSVLDNSPNSICEAQILGVPVVATPVGGVTTLIEDGKTGVLLNANVEPYAEMIEELKANLDLWQRISDSSKEVARVRHDRQKISQSLIDSYREIIAKDSITENA